MRPGHVVHCLNVAIGRPRGQCAGATRHLPIIHALATHALAIHALATHLHQEQGAAQAWRGVGLQAAQACVTSIASGRPLIPFLAHHHLHADTCCCCRCCLGPCHSQLGSNTLGRVNDEDAEKGLVYWDVFKTCKLDSLKARQLVEGGEEAMPAVAGARAVCAL